MEYLVRKKEFQAVLGVQNKTVSRWISMGLPHSKPSINVCFIDINQAIRWFQVQNTRVYKSVR